MVVTVVLISMLQLSVHLALACGALSHVMDDAIVIKCKPVKRSKLIHTHCYPSQPCMVDLSPVLSASARPSLCPLKKIGGQARFRMSWIAYMLKAALCFCQPPLCQISQEAVPIRVYRMGHTIAKATCGGFQLGCLRYWYL